MLRSGRFGGFDFRDIRVLVVEDEPVSRKMIERALEGLGCDRIETCEDGLQALSILTNATQSFDVVLTDYRMPKMNGLELLKKIRCGAPGVARDTIVGMLTGFAENEIVGLAFNLDVDFFVVKPPKASGLKARLSQALTSNRIIRTPMDYDRMSDDPKATPAAQEVHPILKDLSGETPVDPGPSTLPKRPVIVQSVKAVPVGAVVGRPVETSEGIKIVDSGHALTPRLIDRLKDLAEVDEKVRTISIESPDH